MVYEGQENMSNVEGLIEAKLHKIKSQLAEILTLDGHGIEA